MNLISLKKNWCLIINDFIKKSGWMCPSPTEEIIKYEKKKFTQTKMALNG